MLTPAEALQNGLVFLVCYAQSCLTVERHIKASKGERSRLYSMLHGISFADLSPGCICLMTRAGLPPTTVQAGTSFVTTAPAPMTAQSPTATPPAM